MTLLEKEHIPYSESTLKKRVDFLVNHFGEEVLKIFLPFCDTWSDNTIKRGSYQTAFIGNPKGVVKFFYADALIKDISDISEENYLWKKETLETHLALLRDIFGDLYPRPKVILGFYEGLYRLLLIQKNLNTFQTPWYVHTNSDALPQNFFTYVNNPQLIDDLKTLLSGWKKLKTYGLSLDICTERNLTVREEINNGIKSERIKIFDTIPLLILDEEKYKKSPLFGRVITVSPSKEDVIGSEKLFSDICSFLREAETQESIDPSPFESKHTGII